MAVEVGVVPSIVDLDPEDPTQLLDEVPAYHVEEFAVEAQPQAESRADLEASQDLDALGDEADGGGAETDEVPSDTRPHDVGVLYGVHEVPAVDTSLASGPDHGSFQDETLGETWLESLEATSAENGPEPEHILDVVDDGDPEHPQHHKSDTRDRPVADKGSGGPGGL